MSSGRKSLAGKARNATLGACPHASALETEVGRPPAQRCIDGCAFHAFESALKLTCGIRETPGRGGQATRPVPRGAPEGSHSPAASAEWAARTRGPTDPRQPRSGLHGRGGGMGGVFREGRAWSVREGGSGCGERSVARAALAGCLLLLGVRGRWDSCCCWGWGWRYQTRSLPLWCVLLGQFPLFPEHKLLVLLHCIREVPISSRWRTFAPHRGPDQPQQRKRRCVRRASSPSSPT